MSGGVVVVGIDESDHAANALRWARREAELHGWRVTAVMAWGFLDQHTGQPFDPGYSEADAKSVLHALVARALGADAAAGVDQRTVLDLPGRALVEASADAELLVIGARGSGGFKGLLLGSVSQRCIHEARVPVAVVRGNADESVSRVITGVDGSDTAQRALQWSLDEARMHSASVTLVNGWYPWGLGPFPYVETPVPSRELQTASDHILDDAIALATEHAADVSIERVSKAGNPASLILEMAGPRDLIVLGARSLGRVERLLVGSVTTQVTQHATTTVVVIPPSD